MVIVTGGGSGIGRALAYELANRGYEVLIVGRRLSLLQEAAQLSHRITYLALDVSLESDRRRLCAHVSNCSITALVHNAGTIEPIAPIEQIELEAWRACFATNVEAPLFLTQALLPNLTGGRVLHIGSGAAYFPVTGWTAYCASKAALSMLTRSWQQACAHVAFASVMPGIIDTPMQARVRESIHMDEKKLTFFHELKAHGGLISSETVAVFLAWLLFDVDAVEYASIEWDIYQTEHHKRWLRSPHIVPPLP